MIATAVTGCGDPGPTGSGGSPAPPPIAALLVETPGNLFNLEEGDVVTVTVNPVAGDGALVEGASPLVFFESTDPTVLAPAEGPGGSIRPAAEPARRTFRAVGPGEADLRITYPCAAADPGCTPSRSTTVPVRVRPALSSIAFEPGSPVTIAQGTSRVVEVRLLDREGDLVARAETDVEITVEPPGTVTVDREDGPVDGILSLELRGDAAGEATLRFGHPRLSPPVELAVTVVPAVALLVVLPRPITLEVDQVAIVSILALGPTGLPIAGAENAIAVESDQPSVASIVDVSNPIPRNGEIKVRVRGESDGETTLRATYPGLEAVRVPLTVGGSAGSTPDIDRFAGAYDMLGLLREDTCGGAPQTLSGPIGAFVEVTTFIEAGLPMIRVNNGIGSFVGEYEASTGAWSGTFEENRGDGGSVRMRHEGKWSSGNGGVPAYRGLLVIRELLSDGTERCRFVYDVEYLKR